MEYNFEEVEPDDDVDYVSEPQLSVLHTKEGGLKVIIYLMINTADSITKVFVSPGMGKTKIVCKPSNENGVACASLKLTKLIFRFPNSQGMCTNFDFVVK